MQVILASKSPRRRLLLQAAGLAVEVCFSPLSPHQIDTYLQHNEVLDKAGAYEIQGGAASFVRAVKGPLDNVIGLPVNLTLNMLEEVSAP